MKYVVVTGGTSYYCDNIFSVGKGLANDQVGVISGVGKGTIGIDYLL